MDNLDFKSTTFFLKEIFFVLLFFDSSCMYVLLLLKIVTFKYYCNIKSLLIITSYKKSITFFLYNKLIVIHNTNF